MGGITRRRVTQSERGLTPLVAVVLVVGIVVVASVGILFVATETIADAEERAALEHVEGSFVSLSKSVDTSGADDDSTRSIDLAVDQHSGELRVVEDGEIDVSVNNSSIFAGGSIPLNAIEYESRSGTTVVYQGGGVWRRDGDGVSIVSSPNVHFRDQTLTLPVATIDADQAGGDSFTIESERNATHYSGLVVDGPLTINVTTSYADGWARYFEYRFPNASVDVVPGATPDDPKTVVVTIDVADPPTPTTGPPLNVRTPLDGVLAVNGTAGMKGNGGSGNITAAEDVTIEVNPSYPGTIRAAGDVIVQSPVHGDVIAGGSIYLDNAVIHGSAIAGGNIENVHGGGGPAIHDDAVAYGDIDLGGMTVGGEAIANGSITMMFCGSDCHPYEPTEDIDRHPDDYLVDFDEYTPLDSTIEGMIDTGDANGETFITLTGGETLQSGTYYVDEIDVNNGGDVTLDVQDGDINLVVRNDFVLTNDASDFHVVNSGEHVARIYLGGDFLTPVGGAFEICPTNGITCLDDANALQIYGKSSMTTDLNQDTTVHALIYAPESTFNADNAPDLFGAVVTGSFHGDNDAKFEYDEDLRTDFDVPYNLTETTGGAGSPNSDDGSVRYLHVTGYDVAVEE